MKKSQKRNPEDFCETFPVYDLEKIWSQYVETLEEQIIQCIPDCRERFEYACNKHGEDERLIGYRSCLGNLLGTIECYSDDDSEEKYVLIFLRPDKWGGNLGHILLKEGIRTWKLNLKKDKVYFVGCLTTKNPQPYDLFI